MVKRLYRLCCCLLLECGCAFPAVTLVDIYLHTKVRKNKACAPSVLTFVVVRCFHDSERKLKSKAGCRWSLQKVSPEKLNQSSCGCGCGGMVFSCDEHKGLKNPSVCEFKWQRWIKISICVIPHVSLAVSSEVGWDSWIRDSYKCQHAWLSVAKLRGIHY